MRPPALRHRGVPAFAHAFADAVLLVVEDYLTFLRGLARTVPEDGDAKGFAARHTAGRAALGHLEHLLKLIRGDGAGEEPVREGVALLHQAQDALGPPEAEEEHADGDDDGGG